MFSFFKKRKVEPIDERLNDAVAEPNLAELLGEGGADGNHQKLQNIIERLDECSSGELNYLTAELLIAMGYQPQIIDGYNDQGIDIIGFKGNRRALAVQCKAWNPRRTNERIGAKDVQAFKGRLLAEEYQYGLFVTTHYFNDYALKERHERLFLIDRRRLITLLGTFFPEVMAKSYYRLTLNDLQDCPNCNSGKLLKLYSRKRRFYYGWCESCNGVGKAPQK